MIGIVADDLTGAGDISSMYARCGLQAFIYPYDRLTREALDDASLRRAAVVVLDTGSRLDNRDTAYRKTHEATMRLKKAGATQYFNKTCSVFRGNVGAAFDAMLDALGESFAVIVLGFPKNGRTTVDGIHYVRGTKLEDSEFKDDPVHPMRESRLAAILGAQTKRKIDSLDYRIVSQGAERLREAIAAKRSSCNYLILDVESQQSLGIIAQAVRDERVLCGSSGLSEELARLLPPGSPEQGNPLPPLRDDLGIPVTAGSLMPQTQGQIRYLQANGVTCLELDSRQWLDESLRQRSVREISERVAEELRAGRNMAFHASHAQSVVEETRSLGIKWGLTRPEVSRIVSSCLADITARVLDLAGQNRFVVAGGETSAAVCERLGVQGMRVWKELAPGLPSCISLGASPKFMILKSGSFGRTEFLADALAHLRSQ